MSATLPGGRPVDIEMIADFVEGLLPAADAEQVRDLIRADPAWAAAATAVEESMPAVAAAVAGYPGGIDEPMPAGVSDRIFSALRAEKIRPPDDPAEPRTQHPASPDVSMPAKRSRGPADNRPGNAPDGTDRSGSRPITARRTGIRAGWARGALVSALVLAVVGIGFVIIHGGSSAPSMSTSSKGAARPAAVRALPHPTDRPGLVVAASGTDYTRLVFHDAGGTQAPGGPVPHAVGGASSGGTSGIVPPALGRLADPAALDACLTAIEQHSGGTAQNVDFATYSGSAALVVSLTAPESVVAAGPGCGISGDADEVAQLSHG